MAQERDARHVKAKVYIVADVATRANALGATVLRNVAVVMEKVARVVRGACLNLAIVASVWIVLARVR